MPSSSDRTPTDAAAGRRALLARLLDTQPPRTAPVSFAQQRLWLLHEMGEGSPAENSAVTLRLRGPLDVAAIERALAEVVRRHGSLRTTVMAVGGAPVQMVAAPG